MLPPDLVAIKAEIDAMPYPKMVSTVASSMDILSSLEAKVEGQVTEQLTAALRRYFMSSLDVKRIKYLVMPNGAVDLRV